ncbi:HAD family hydrolase [Roseobacter sp.]|uniref:HAD family hydrolase n=1 Tax=Roseobacter sp. TaxID=1907202 RepID=UPI00385C866B
MLIRVFVSVIILAGVSAASADPLPSWNETDAKERIIEFVTGVTDVGSDTYVTPADRVAVFDNDGTLWAEQPFYFQALYAFDRIARMGDAEPSILTSDTLKAAAAGDMQGALAQGEEGLLEIVTVSHSGLSVDAFQEDVRDWLERARHPTTDMPYDEMVYQPMLELLSYLRDQDFKTFIVSGGGVHFMRAFAEEAYNIPPEHVIGSQLESSYQVLEGVPTVVKEPGIAFIDDKAGKPVGIDAKIGKRPIFVGGNSDGDFAMLEWSTAGDGPRFGLIVHHTDADREFAYDRDGPVGKLAQGLDEGPDRGWLIVDMKEDWSQIWP